MQFIRKKILTDEAMRPVAVQIAYADWIQIERLLGLQSDQTNGHSAASSVQQPSFPLRGSVLKYEDPFGPAADESDWDSLR